MEERLIVTDRCYWPLLLQYKKENPFSCFKLVDCEELLDLLSFSWKEGAIQRLMSKGLDYMDAKKWLRLLRVCDASQNEKAQKISGWLEDYKSSDPLLAKAMLRKCKICLLEMDEDSEIQSLLQRKNIPFYRTLKFHPFSMKKRLPIESMFCLFAINSNNIFMSSAIYVNVCSKPRKIKEMRWRAASRF